MLSIQNVQSSVHNYKNTQIQNKKNNNVITLHANNPNLLQNYLTLVGKQNLSLISFGSKNFVTHTGMIPQQVRPFDGNFSVDAFRPGLSSYAQWKIREEATSRIYGKYNWPKIDNINAWMVTAETDRFMMVGGLGKVAADLPNSFNQRYANDSKNKMTNITPLYTYKDEYKIIEENGKKYYQYGSKFDEQKQRNIPRLIEIQEVGKINVPIYNPQANTRLQDTEVVLYKAYADYTTNKETGKPNNDGTEYIFLHTPAIRIDKHGNEIHNARIFDTEDPRPGSENNKTPYALNTVGTDEVTRMAFFSKAVYTLMKDIKEGKIKTIDAPNSVLLNDWHAGPLAAMIHYTANAEADSGRISQETGQYFNEVPTIFIAHNLEHQGSTNGDDGKRKSIFGTLFGEYSVDILANARSWRSDDPKYNPKDEDKISMMKGYNFNSAITGIMLADRIVPVSENYAEELIHSNIKANGLKDVLNARAFSPFISTLTPITNGYSKALIEPTKENMDKLIQQTNKDLTVNNKLTIRLDDIDFRPFDDGNIENKIYNKNEVMDIFRRLLEREQSYAYNNESPARKYHFHDPINTVLPNTHDYRDIPVVVFSGRVDPQKGLDTILKDALWQFARENAHKPIEEIPVFIIGGKITQDNTYQALRQMKDEMLHADNGAYANVAKRIVLINGYVNTNLVATAADLFMVPSVFEPCGLTQMEAMAKGALPVATSTGGLVNTIIDGVDGFRTKAFFDQQGWQTKERIYGEGFSTNGEAFCETLNRALDTFKNNRPKFTEMQKTAISNDFSWNKRHGALDRYINLIRTGNMYPD